MELHIAGGCGEHGRNCFHVIGDTGSFLVDCGIMAVDGSEGMPHLNPDEIARLKCVFLTHSHIDHSGALSWLYSKGFSGTVIASEETLSQLPVRPADALSLEQICPGKIGSFENISIRWGCSGHCIGSVWYLLGFEGKKILFTGDYCENTLINSVDPIRDITADMAVIDCAYGQNCTEYKKYATAVLWQVKKWLKRQSGTVILPVPRYGRGIELLSLFISGGLNVPVYGDDHFIKQFYEFSGSPWYKSSSLFEKTKISHVDSTSKGLIFLSDPQLHFRSNRNMVCSFLEKNARVLLTGTSQKNSFSSMLAQHDEASFLRYPVHQNLKQFQDLEIFNSFSCSIPCHTSEFKINNRLAV